MSKQSANTSSRHKLLLLLLVTALLLAVGWYAYTQLSLDQLANQEERLRDYITLHPWLGFFSGFTIYLILAFIPGTGGKAVIVGWLFGFWQALLIVTIGLTIAAMGIFSLSRYLVRDTIERRYSNMVRIMNRHLEKDGVFYLLFLRMAHAPYSIVNPVSGASRVPAWSFCWTTIVGLLPANVIWIYVGLHLPSLSELAANGAEAFINLPLLIALILCALFPLLIRWLKNRWQTTISKVSMEDDDDIFT